MPTDPWKWRAGDLNRRAVLGDQYVDKVYGAWPPALELQDLITEFVWGSIWTRPGLPHQVRSLVNIGILTALNRIDELRLHVGGALRNGCTVDELVEVAMQCAVYCGVPSAIDTAKVIREESEVFSGPQHLGDEEGQLQ